MPVKKINVLFLSSWYPTRIKPTDGNFVQKHAEAVALYADVNVLHVAFDNKTDVKKDYQKEIQNNVTSHIIYLRKPEYQIPLISPLIKFIKFVRAYYYGYKLIYNNKQKPDIVHANILIPVGMIAYFFYLTKKIPYIITEHWTGYLPQDPNKPGKKLVFFKCFAKKAAALLPVTQHLVEAMKSFSIHGNYAVVPNVVDTSLFVSSLVRNEAIKRIIHISSLLDGQKNFSGILVALSHLTDKRSDFVLEVISDGDYEQFHRKCEKLNLSSKIIFHGKKNTAEVAAIMQGCDFLLLFSNYENFPCVIAEAMACGLPVLTSDVGGISEHINETNGILVEARDADALTTQLDIMLDICRNYDKKQIRAYAEKHFSYEVIGKQYNDIYKNCLSP